MPAFVSFLLAALFGAGLVIGGMTQPAKIIGFLDPFGDWDPSLVCVMGGALFVYAPVYRWLIRRRQTSLLGEQFRLTTKRDIDGKLMGGALLFGIGWGIGGFCPGPALAAAGALVPSALLFSAAMFAGLGLGELLKARSTAK
ncbi:MAG: hypothetical protein H6715_01655 [Myxococcales bacterium]|nr:hypothetical protein [Myxococcales bacterium]MCB9709002.1 hypothetical protein [Myxococcales bacterium]